jgi:hypothetical protein
MRRAIEKYDVNVVGLTLSKNQATHVQKSFDEMDWGHRPLAGDPRSKRVLLNGGEHSTSPSTGSCRSVPSNTSGMIAMTTSSKWFAASCPLTA